MSRFFSGDPTEVGQGSRFFRPSTFQQPRTLDANQYEIDLASYGNLVKDKHDLISGNPYELEDLAAENQLGAVQLTKGVGRFVTSTGLKLGQGVAFLGSAVLLGAAEAGQALSNVTGGVESDRDFFTLENMTDNPLVNALMKAEEAVKDSPMFKIYKPSDWDDRTIWQQLGSTAWWADEFADGAAFAAQAYLSAGGIGALRLGSAAVGAGRQAQINALNGLARKAATPLSKQGTMGGFSNAWRSSIDKMARNMPTRAGVGKALDQVSQVGIMTATEAMFEARDTGHTVQQRLLEDAGYGDIIEGMSPEEQTEFLNGLPEDVREDLKQKKGQAMQNTFIANMAAISFSNWIEVSALNKFMGRAMRNLTGTSAAASRGIDLGEGMLDAATAVKRKGLQRFLGRGSRPRMAVTEFAKQAASEGFYEENIQNSISNISEHFDGAIGFEYMTDVLQDMVDNTFSGDKDAWKSIVTGGILGGLMGGAAGIKSHNRAAKERQEIIDNINSRKSNVVKLADGALYNRDESGKVILNEDGSPQINREAVMEHLANQNKMIDLAELHDLYLDMGDKDLAGIVWNDAITELALSYNEAGFGEDFIKKAQTYKGFTKENLEEATGIEQERESVENASDLQSENVEDKVRRLETIARQVKQDYEAITSLIPNTDQNNLRINTAVKVNSRLRSLAEKKTNNQQTFDELLSKRANNFPTSINLKIDRIKALEGEIKSVNEKYPEAAKKLQRSVDRLKKEVEQEKTLNKNRLVEEGSSYTPGIAKVPETDNSPERIRIDKLNNRLAQFDSAIETQLEKYNKLVTDPKGWQKEVVDVITEASKKLRQEDEIYENIRDSRIGDYVEVTKHDGTKEILPITRTEQGTFIGETAANNAKELNAVYSSIRPLSSEEREAYIESRALEFRKNQIRNRISQIQERIKNLKERQEKTIEALLAAEDTLNSLQTQKATGKTRKKPSTLDRQIRETENLIIEIQQEIDLIDELLVERQESIESLETVIANDFIETDLDLLNRELDLLKEEYEKAEAERDESVKFLDKLKDYYNFLKAYWRKFFPDKRRTFQDFEDAQAVEGTEEFVRMRARVNTGVREQWNDPSDFATQEEAFIVEEVDKALSRGQEYTDFSKDMDNTKAEIAERESMIKALEERRNELKKKVEFRETELKQYEAFLNVLENPTVLNPVAGQEENSKNPVTKNGDYRPKAIPEDGQNFSPRKNIVNGLFTTTGNSTVNTPEMNRWFKFTETAELSPDSQLMLLPVTINHPIFGIGGTHDLFSSEPEAFRTINNIKVVPIRAVDPLSTEYGGLVPHLIDGQIVSTSLVEITPEQTTFHDFKLRDGSPMFHNRDKLTNKQISKIIEDYRTLTDTIKKDATEGRQSKFLYVKNKSWGRVNSDGIHRNANEAFGYVPQLEVSIKSDVKHMTVSYDVEIGMGYVWHKGRPIPAKSRKINREEAVEGVKLLKDLAKDPSRNDINNPILKRLKSVIFMGKSSDPKYSTFFARGNDVFYFGETSITLNDLIEGRYDNELIEHLMSLNHQINLSQLKEESSYKSFTGETYPTYNDYLLNPLTGNRNNVNLPVTFDIVAPSEDIANRQIDGIYLSFGKNVRKTAKKKKPQTKVTAAQKDKENPTTLSYSKTSDTIAEANKRGVLTAEEQAEIGELTSADNQKRLDSITENSNIVTLDNGVSYVIDRENQVIFDTEVGAVVNSKDLRSQIIQRENPTVDSTETTDPIKEAEVSEQVERTEQTPDEQLAALLKEEVDSPFDAFKDSTEPTATPSTEATVEQNAPTSDFLKDQDFGFRSLTDEEYAKARRQDAAETKKVNKKEFNEESKDNDDAPFLLKSSVTDYKQADIEQELQELERLVGSKALAGVVSGLIRNKAFGQTLEDGRILLSELMTEGTAYHEAFHRIFEGIINPQRVQEIIQEWRNNNPESEFSDYQVIEELAEEFRDYMLTNRRPEGLLGRAFNWIKNLVNSLLGIPVSMRDRLFYKIRQGDFKDATVNRSIRPEVYSETDGTLLRNAYGTVVEREVMEGLSYAFLENLIGNNFNIDDILNFNIGALEAEDSARFRNIYAESLKSVIQEIHRKRKSNPNEITNNLLKDLAVQHGHGTRSRLFSDFSNYLQRFNITLNEEKQNEDLTEDERSKDTLGIISSVEFNVKSGVPNTVKLVIASLPNLNSDGTLNRNGLGLPRLSNYKRNLAVLHNQLAGLETLEEMRDKVVELSATYPEYSMLLDRLGIPTEGDEILTDSTPVEVVRLQNQFKQQFDKANKTYFLQLYGEDGNSYFTDANSERAEDLLKQKWAANFRLLPKQNLKLVNGRYVFDPKFFKKYKTAIRSKDGILSFYKAMGIEFSRPEALTPQQEGKLRSEAKHFFEVIERGDVDSLFDPDLNITGRINELVAVELAHTIDFSDNQHINAEGKTVHGITLNTYLDLVIRKINKAVPDFLKWNESTQTGNAFTRNSLFLKNGYRLKLDILGGAKTVESDTDSSGLGSDKLSRSEAAVQHFSSVMNGIFPFIRQGDRKIEYAITLQNRDGSRIKPNSFGINTIQDAVEVMKGYLADELLTSWQLNKELATEGSNSYGANIPTYKEAAKDLRVFEGIFDKNLTKRYQTIINKTSITQKQAIKEIAAFLNGNQTTERVGKALGDYIESKTDAYLQEFVNNGTLSLVNDVYINHGLPKEIVGDSNAFTKEEINSYIERFTILYQIGNIEQEKLFTGDFAFYKKKGNVHDFFKRTSGLGGTGKTLRNDDQFNQWMQKNMSRPDRDVDGNVETWVFDDVKVKSALYNEYIKNLVDNFNFTEKEATRLLSPYNGYEEADAQGYVTLPEYKELLFRAGDWTTSHELVYQKILNREQLTAEDAFTFPPLKPQYFGPQVYDNLYVPTFYKLSLMPLIPSMLPEGSPLIKLNDDMLSNGVGISTFTSGNKVGKLDGQSFYNENGSYNEGGKQKQILDYDFMKIQLDMTPEKHDRVTFGTQFRKLVLSNLVGKTLYSKTSNSKTGEDLIKQFNDLINEQITLEKETILNRLEAKQVGDKIEISKQKLADLLKDEAFKRAAPNNVIDDIEAVLSKNRNAEIMITRGNMESILMSIMNNSMIHNKVFGDMMVQASSTGYEGRNRTKLQKDVQGEPWASDLGNLGFYQYGNSGTTAMEIYVPHRFKELYGEDVNISEIDPRLLELIGFRIPTQGLNSIEVIKIKGFLPQEAGNTVIVPSEIVAKAGSDFDIDKLTLFLPNYKVKYKKALKRDALARFPQLATNTSFSTLIGNKRSYRFIDNVATYEELEGQEGILDATETALLEMYKQFRRESEEGYVEGIEYVEYDKKDKKGVQNEIIRLSREIVLAPENFKDLITPISSELIKSEARYLESIMPSLIEEKNRGNYIDFDYIMSVREDFLTGKDGVGIAASNLTHHVLSQQAGLKINTDKTWINLDHNGQGTGKVDLSGTKSINNTDNPTAETILDTISAFLNGFVDISKDPFLRVINASTDTAGTYLYLIRAGVPLRQAVLFMNQPIVLDYLKNLKLGQSLARKASGKNKSYKTIEEETRSNYIVSDNFDMSNTVDREAYLELMKPSKMKEAIEGKLSEVEFNRMQDQVLTDFLEYTNASGKLLKLHQATNADTKGTGPSMFSASDLIQRFEEIKNEGYFENVDKFETETIIGTFNDSVKTTVDTYRTVYPLLQGEAFKTIANDIVSILRRNKFITDKKVEKTITTLENDFIGYMFQHSLASNGVKRGTLIKDLFSGENSLPKYIARIKNDPNNPLTKNLLIEELYPILSSSSFVKETGKDFDNLKFFSRRTIKEHADDITNAWEELASLQPTLAHQIFTFGVLQSSFNNSPIEFLKFAPPRVYSNILFKAINIDASSQELDMEDFKRRFFKNNMFNSDLVPYVKSHYYAFDFATGRYTKKEAIKNNTITAAEKHEGYPFVRTSIRKNPMTKERKHLLFEETGKKENGYPLYALTGKLGNGMYFKEWVGESAIVENRGPVETERLSPENLNNLTDAQIKQEILDSKLTEEQKTQLLASLNSSLEVERGKVIKDFCNLI